MSRLFASFFLKVNDTPSFFFDSFSINKLKYAHTYLDAPAFLNALKYPTNVPTPILKRFHLVTILEYVQDAKDLNVPDRDQFLVDAYHVFQHMDLPFALEYSDDCLNVHLEFQTQIVLEKLKTIQQKGQKEELIASGWTTLLPILNNVSENQKKTIQRKWKGIVQNRQDQAS